MSCCAAVMRNLHILSHWFFIKIKRFAPPAGARNVADFRPKRGPRSASRAGGAGAPEALLPARDDLPVVDVVRNATLERGDQDAEIGGGLRVHVVDADGIFVDD